MPVAPDEVKHLRQALPFMLEESLLEDVTELHFAHAPLDNESHAVAVVGQGAMAQWADDMPEELTELPWIPEALCLPWSEGQCTLLFEAGPRVGALVAGRRGAGQHDTTARFTGYPEIRGERLYCLWCR